MYVYIEYLNLALILRKFVSRGLTQTLVLAKKMCDENRKKETNKER